MKVEWFDVRGGVSSVCASGFRAWKARVLLLCVFCLPGMSGCNSVRVKLGMRVYIAKLPVSSMDASLPKDPAGIAPGEKSPLVATFKQPNGKVLATEGQGKGKVLWSDMAVAATLVSVNKKGVVSLPHDPRKSDGKMGHVTITVPSHPDLKAELDIPVRYDYAFSANFPGSNGPDGMAGTDGTDGTSGSDGSTDPNNPSPGGNGTPGTSGSNGTDGGNGGDAPDVEVKATLRAGSHPLLQVSVAPVAAANGLPAQGMKERFFLIDPQGGTLTVTAVGGAGGRGGRGGKGGRGGSGGSGIPPGVSGTNGQDGMNGSDGSPGRSGRITVTYDPSVKPYLGLIHLSNPGAAKPVFSEAAVGPLW